MLFRSVDLDQGAFPLQGSFERVSQWSRKSVYVIDDDAAVRDSIRVLLECENIRVREFASCEELLSAPTPWNLNCLILDVNLPGMNGLDFLEGLRARGFAGPTIVTTGHADPVVRHRTAEARAALLEKPFEVFALVNVVLKQLAG
jgi:two-component system response regulator FixJ